MQLWLDAATRVGPMRDSLGRSIEVVYPGRRTGLAGPDLQDAIVSIDGGPARRVDVEVHLHEASWERHGHDTDARYAGDLLHLVWTVGAPRFRASAVHPGAAGAGRWTSARRTANE